MRSFGTAFIGVGITASIAVNCFQVKTAYGWGKLGHYTVATMASHFLDENSKQKIREIQRPEETLANVSDWADRVRHVEYFNFSRTFHYTNLEEHETYQTAKINKQGDVVQALIYYEDQLRDPKTPPAQKRMALNFVIHFVGDIHQPLHIGWGHDEGGNEIQVKSEWNKKMKINGEVSISSGLNLHTVYDSTLIKDFAGKRWQLNYDTCPENYAKYLEGNFKSDTAGTSGSTGALAEGSYLDWVQEGQALLPDVYQIGDGTLGVSYYERSMSVVNSQMAKAGYRLAALLNRIFNQVPLTSAEIGMRTIVKTLCDNQCYLK